MVGGGCVLAAVAIRPGRVRALAGSWVIVARLAVAIGAMAGYQFLYYTAITDAGAAIAAVLAMSSVPLFAGLLSRFRGRALNHTG